MIYLFALFLILLGVYNYDYRGLKHGRAVWLAVIYIILVCIAGFRYRIGGDTIQYMHYYDMVHPLGELNVIDFQKTRYAPGFIIFASICKSISPDFTLVQFLVAAFLNFAVLFFFTKNSRHPFFGVLLYYFFMYVTLNMEVMRESIAVAIFLLSWHYLKERKLLKYYLCAILAIFFHISALILLFIPLVFLPGIRNFFYFGMRTIFIVLGVLIVGFAIRYYLFDLIQIISINEKMTELAHKYAGNDLGGLKTLNIFGAFNTLFIYVAYPCVAIFFLKSSNKRQYNLEESLSVISIYVSLLSVSVIIIGRFNNYFMFFSYLILSDWIFSQLKFRNKKVKLNFGNWTLIFLPLFLFSIYSVYFSNVNRDGTLQTYMKYYPYNTIFDREMDPDREKVFRYNINRGF